MNRLPTSRPLSTSLTPDDSRYVIERKLGEGGAGTVYLARDRETGEHVALKKLLRVDAKSVLRLKREFRSLVDINHPHLIKLYDMGRTGEGWFLTMEYLEGTDLTSYLEASESAMRRTSIGNARARLMSSFVQLANGIHALHQAGMLHRDLKPSNVLVVDHRVVVLDFGLVRELDTKAVTVTEDGAVAGTPAYMAPEQLLCKELSAACDWYAFGAMLYEALSGVLPIEGTLVEILRRKLETDPTPLAELAPWAPNDVLELCMALLRRNPAERPSAPEILRVLARTADEPQTPTPRLITEQTVGTESDANPAEAKLVGRAPELAALWQALDEVERSGAVVMHVRGPSGTGKSALVEQFLDDVEEPEVSQRRLDALVLRSRCYELEAMPFKALDGVMDALVRHLSHLDDLAVAHMMPPDVAALTQLFPAFERLAAVQHLLRAKTHARDAILDRQLAETALRTLLESVALRKTVVVWIDDLQWGDLDSARILQTWLLQPTRARILFIFTYRSEEVYTSACLTRLLHRDAAAIEPRATQHVIDLNALPAGDIHALCELRLGELARSHVSVVERIVAEAQGSPFLASQLVALALAKFARGDRDWNKLTIEALIDQMSEFLPVEARTLLAVLAVAGRPMMPKLALQAAGIVKNGRALVHALRGLNLVRSREINGARMIEVYHDRVRERMRAVLSGEQSLSIHRKLFQALEISGVADADFLHTLALGADERAAALSYGQAAAERATEALAFERAAEVYQRCIQLADTADRAGLWQQLAVALGRCGRGTQAADAYLEAAQHVPARESVMLRQMAAGHLLRCGRFEQGAALVDQVLADMDIRLPTSEVGLKAAIVWHRTRLALRGRPTELRAAADVPAELIARHDVCENLGSVTLQVDPLRATLLQLLGLHCALEAREPDRLVHGMCRVAIAAAIEATPKATRESDALLDRAQALAQAAPQARGVVTSSRSIASYFLGRHRRVIEYSQAALHELRTDTDADTRGNYYRRHMVSAMRLGSLYMLAEHDTLVRELAALVQEARATDNCSLLLNLALVQILVDELLDQVAGARARLDQQREQLPKQGFGMPNVLHLASVMTAACVNGDYAWAALHLEGEWERFMRSPLARSGWLAIGARSAHARMLLNQNATEGNDPARLRAIRRDWQWLEGRSQVAYQRVAARLAYAAGDRAKALEHLREEQRELDAFPAPVEFARSSYAIGALLGDSQGAAQCEAALRTLSELGAVNPQAMMRACFPELIRTA